MTGKWKNINLPALKSRKHVCREDWHFGVQIEKEVFDEGINSSTRLFFLILKLALQVGPCSVFFIVVKHEEKRCKLFLKIFL